MEKDIVSFEQYYLGILDYIESYRPPTLEVLTFIGTLIRGIVEDIEITPKEKEIYINAYNMLITKRLGIAKEKREVPALVTM